MSVEKPEYEGYAFHGPLSALTGVTTADDLEKARQRCQSTPSLPVDPAHPLHDAVLPTFTLPDLQSLV